MISVLEGLDTIEDWHQFQLLIATRVESEPFCIYYLVGIYFNSGLNSTD